MITSVSRSSVILTDINQERLSKSDSRIESAALPVISMTGDRARTIGSSAAPGCGPCWVVCLANPLWVPTCAAICAAMCVTPFDASSK